MAAFTFQHLDLFVLVGLCGAVWSAAVNTPSNYDVAAIPHKISRLFDGNQESLYYTAISPHNLPFWQAKWNNLGSLVELVDGREWKTSKWHYEPSNGLCKEFSELYPKLAAPRECNLSKHYALLGNNAFMAKDTAPPDSTDRERLMYPLVANKYGAFDFAYNPSAIFPSGNKNATTSNAFFWVNYMHDFFHSYGFDEQSGNFQYVNFGNKGWGRDPVLVTVQDSRNPNNAAMISNLDGDAGRMQFGLDDTIIPLHDYALDVSMIIHECTHGVVRRLADGADTISCLTTTESLGMNEGYADTFAILLQLAKDDGREKEIEYLPFLQDYGGRIFRYSTNMTVNPLTYTMAKEYFAVKDEWLSGKYKYVIGCLWASMLYETYFNIRDKMAKNDKFFNEDWLTADELRKVDHGSKISAPNTYMALLVVESLRWLECNPTMVDGLDALLKADSKLTNGEYGKEIRAAFRRRGVESPVSAVPSPASSDETKNVQSATE